MRTHSASVIRHPLPSFEALPCVVSAHIFELAACDWLTLQRLRRVSHRWRVLASTTWRTEADVRHSRWLHVAQAADGDVTQPVVCSDVRLVTSSIHGHIASARGMLQHLPAFAPPVALPVPFDVRAQQQLCRHWIATLRACVRMRHVLPCLHFMKVELALFRSIQCSLHVAAATSSCTTTNAQLIQLHASTMRSLHTLCGMSIQVIMCNNRALPVGVWRERFSPTGSSWSVPRHRTRVSRTTWEHR